MFKAKRQQMTQVYEKLDEEFVILVKKAKEKILFVIISLIFFNSNPLLYSFTIA